MLVPSESSGGFERGDFPLQSVAVPSLQLQAVFLLLKHFQMKNQVLSSGSPLRDGNPHQAVLSTPQWGHSLMSRATCPSAGQLGLAVGAPARQ